MPIIFTNPPRGELGSQTEIPLPLLLRNTGSASAKNIIGRITFDGPVTISVGAPDFREISLSEQNEIRRKTEDRDNNIYLQNLKQTRFGDWEIEFRVKVIGINQEEHLPSIYLLMPTKNEGIDIEIMMRYRFVSEEGAIASGDTPLVARFLTLEPAC